MARAEAGTVLACLATSHAGQVISGDIYLGLAEAGASHRCHQGNACCGARFIQGGFLATMYGQGRKYRSALVNRFVWRVTC
jgi:hypothetical protein